MHVHPVIVRTYAHKVSGSLCWVWKRQWLSGLHFLADESG